MPNTPALLGEGSTGISPGKYSTKDDLENVKILMNSVGISFELQESLLDAVTGLSGSGPAYVYMFIEAMADGGVK